jgi:trans-aconitate methyltransferase
MNQTNASSGPITQRIPEPELMDSTEQVEAYAGADFSESDTRFIQELCLAFPEAPEGITIDLGCGPGNICIKYAERNKNATIIGLDGGANMLKKAEEFAGHTFPNLRFQFSLLPAVPESLKGKCALLLSNSLLHHLTDPMALWNAMLALAKPGAKFFVGDLHRPATFEEALIQKNTYAANAPAVLQEDFYNSLLAAYTTEEIESQLNECGIRNYHIFRPTDRHVYIYGSL